MRKMRNLQTVLAKETPMPLRYLRRISMEINADGKALMRNRTFLLSLLAFSLLFVAAQGAQAITCNRWQPGTDMTECIQNGSIDCNCPNGWSGTPSCDTWSGGVCQGQENGDCNTNGCT